MAFFDDFGKKLTQAGQSVVNKTKEVGEIAKVSLAVAEEEKNLTNLYCQLGKLYLQLHADDYQEGLAQTVEDIKTCQAKIDEYRNTLRELKGIAVCEKCGAEVAANASFCSGCGNKITQDN